MPRTIAYRAGGFTNCGISYTKFSQEELAEMKDRTMTENEAIKELETSINLAKRCTQNYERKREIQGYEMAIKALEEVQKYRAIGTPEECRAAVEKQTVKKMESPWCPCCGKFLTTEYMNKRYHCIYCGQLLEWEGERWED